MRRFLPAFLLALAAFVPFSVGCDLVKNKDGADAGLVVGAVVDAGAGLPTATPTDTTAPAVTAAAPLGATAATPTGTVRVGDAGKPIVKDAGPVDAAAAPAAPGFPTALPPFPTALPGIDAGMFKLPDGGFKPPWVQ